MFFKSSSLRVTHSKLTTVVFLSSLIFPNLCVKKWHWCCVWDKLPHAPTSSNYTTGLRRRAALCSSWRNLNKSMEDFILMADDMTERQACWLMLQAVQAVKHCHERGVFHGDIHTGNFLVSHHSLELKLIDFRCARLINTQGFNSSEYQGELACFVTVATFGILRIT